MTGNCGTLGGDLVKDQLLESERNRVIQNITHIVSARRRSFCLGAQLIFSLIARDGCIFKVFIKHLNPGLVSMSLDYVHPGITGLHR